MYINFIEEIKNACPSVRLNVRRLSVFLFHKLHLNIKKARQSHFYFSLIFSGVEKRLQSRPNFSFNKKKNPQKQRTKFESLSQTQLKNIIIMNRLSHNNQGYYMQNLIVIHCSVQDFIFIDSVKSMLCQKMMFDIHIVYFQSYLILTATKTSFKTHFIKSSDLKF